MSEMRLVFFLLPREMPTNISFEEIKFNNKIALNIHHNLKIKIVRIKKCYTSSMFTICYTISIFASSISIICNTSSTLC